jgi:hypothetical protein
MKMAWVSSGVLTLALLGCSSSAEEPTAGTTGPLMRPGDNCLRCHQANSAVGAPEWTAAGTVFPVHDAPTMDGVEGAMLSITDATGHTVSLVTNEVGNFYTDEPLTAPLHVALELAGERIEMPVPAPAGSCNACHSKSPVGGPRGRIFVPGSASDQSQAACDGDHTISFPSDSSYDCAPYRCINGPRVSCLFECVDSSACSVDAQCIDGRCVASKT